MKMNIIDLFESFITRIGAIALFRPLHRWTDEKTSFLLVCTLHLSVKPERRNKDRHSSAFLATILVVFGGTRPQKHGFFVQKMGYM